jgi:hypothetical protein
VSVAGTNLLYLGVWRAAWQARFVTVGAGGAASRCGERQGQATARHQGVELADGDAALDGDD